MSNKIKLMGLLAILSTVSFGAAIDHIQTYSPEYLGNQAQNGMINNSSVYFNPAATTRLEKGTYLHGGAQLALGYEKMNYDDKQYKAKLVQPIPNFAIYDVTENCSTFWTFGGLGGGGSLDYKHGVPGTGVVPDLVQAANNEAMTKSALILNKFGEKGVPYFPFVGVKDNGSSAYGSNIYAQTTLGKAWNIDEKLSVSLAGRVVYGYRKLKANLRLKATPLNKKELEKYYQVSETADYLKKNMGIDIGNIEGLSTMTEAQKMALLGQLNKVYKANKKAGVARAEQKFDQVQDFAANGINARLDSARTAWGYGFQIGMNYQATKKLNLGLRYDSRIKLNFKAHGSNSDVKLHDLNKKWFNLGFGNFFPEYMNGKKERRDLPAILAAGASYKVTDDWTMALSGNYYFNKDAKMDTLKSSVNFAGHRISGLEPQYDNGYELALGTEYRFNPKWAVMGSVNYAYTGAKKEAFDDVEYPVNSTTLGIGVKYNPTPDDEITLAMCHFFYGTKGGHYGEKYQNKVANPTYHKSISAFGASYTHRF